MQQATTTIRDVLIGHSGGDSFKFQALQNIYSALFVSKVGYVLPMFYFTGWQAADGMK